MRPRVIVHNEVSLDGRMDVYAGDMGLYYETAAKLGADASLVGSQTIISGMEQFGDDLETETISDPDGPLLAVVDSRGRIDQWEVLKRQPYWGRIVVLCSEATPHGYTDMLASLDIDHMVHGARHADLEASLEELGTRFGVQVLRIDSGGTLTGVLLREGLVDEVSLLIDPCVVGGESPASVFRAPDVAGADEVTRLALRHFEKLPGDVVWLRYDVERSQ